MKIFFEFRRKGRLYLKVGSLFVLFICLSSWVKGGALSDGGIMESIVLRSEELPFTPDEFYISSLVDERGDKGPVAWLLPGGIAGHSASLKGVDLEGGAIPAIQTFITNGMAANTNLRPVVIRLLECRITEQNGEPGLVEGRVAVALAFDLQKGEERITLGTYNGGARYKRSVGHYAVVEPALRRSLVTALTYVNDWMEREAPGNVKLSKGVKVEFVDYLQETIDTVFYNRQRPLVWEDFKARPRVNRFAAEVFPTFSYKGNSRMEDGYVRLQLQLKVFVLKHSSWVKEGSKDAYGLNHEQRHFDLVKLVAERFRQKILSMPLEPEDFDGRIGYQYLEFFREMNRLQEAYDGETAHGMNKVAQERWNKKIEEELSALFVNQGN